MAVPRPRPLKSLPTDKLSTGCPNLDAALGGGIPCGSLTELAGEAVWRDQSSLGWPGASVPAAPLARLPPAARLHPPPPPILCPTAGESGASKTQLALQLLLTVQLPRAHGGLEGAAVYVCTEGDPPMRRLHQLARCLPLR